MTTHAVDLEVETRGHTHILDLTPQLRSAVCDSPVRDGTVTLFVVGSTAGLTTTEFEPGLVDHDLEALFERLAPAHGQYVHEETWHDDNGHSHVRASLLGPSLVIPVIGGVLPLGTWQQVILIDFDTRPRKRRIVAQFIGE
jgi:secondary thiamine-phosphate synthase enzyme